MEVTKWLKPPNVASWLKADIQSPEIDFRFTPKADIPRPALDFRF